MKNNNSRYSYDDHAGDVNMSNFALADADLKYKVPHLIHATVTKQILFINLLSLFY